MEWVDAKTILSRVDGTMWFGADYNMNLYRGCCHGCIYCDSRSECYGIETFDMVRGKRNALTLLEQELRHKRKKGVIQTGAMSDPYNPYEKKYECTGRALDLLDRCGFGVSIATKSDLIVRDIGRLLAIKRHSPVIAEITVTAADDALCKKVEPHVVPTSRRMDAIKRLSDAGIYCGVLLMPVLPFLEDNEENILKIAQMAKKNGAGFIYADFGVTLRQNQRIYFYGELDRLFPGLKEQYHRHYGITYSCVSPQWKRLRGVLCKFCEENNIQYDMKDIINRYKNEYSIIQSTLFDDI
jgi:DNA repair photolyase